ncbi:MAG: hypothetical protein R2827_04220 [Bdellovibrionales bacterium]
MTQVGAKIMVVDDDVEMREMLEDFITSQGHHVVGFPQQRTHLNPL